jgi:hypothetical protein
MGTPLLFFKGTASLKPFVPQTPSIPRKSAGHTNDVTESMMLTTGQEEAFAFLKADDKNDLLEWENNQAEIDRQWYDAEEDGNIRYGEYKTDPELELK